MRSDLPDVPTERGLKKQRLWVGSALVVKMVLANTIEEAMSRP